MLDLLKVAEISVIFALHSCFFFCLLFMTWQNCSLVFLIHEDIYSSEEGVGVLLHLRYIADLVIRAAPLSTGLAADVHGQVGSCPY